MYFYDRDIYTSPWIIYVRNLLFENGLGYIWVSQNNSINVNHVTHMFKEKLSLINILGIGLAVLSIIFIGILGEIIENFQS